MRGFAFNRAAADLLKECARLLELQGANPFRVNAYRRAAQTIESLQTDVRALAREQGVAGLTALPFIGTGLAQAINEIAQGSAAVAQPYIDNLLLELWRGLPYAVSILLILGAHELGHYFAARRHKLAVTLPYFIPAPPFISLVGTFGAFIQLREPMRNAPASGANSGSGKSGAAPPDVQPSAPAVKS